MNNRLDKIPKKLELAREQSFKSSKKLELDFFELELVIHISELQIYEIWIFAPYIGVFMVAENWDNLFSAPHWVVSAAAVDTAAAGWAVQSHFPKQNKLVNFASA